MTDSASTTRSGADTPSRPRLAASGVVVAALLLTSSGLVGCAGSGQRERETARRAESAQAEQYVQEAKQLREEGKDEEALRLLALAIEKNPTLTTAHMDMGDIYRVQGNYEQAQRRFEDAARLEPMSFNAHYKNGLMLQLLNRLSDAVRAYLRALAIEPDDFEANLNLATAYLSLGEPNQALPYARRAVNIQVDSGPAHANLGAVYSEMGNHELAVREYEAAAELMELSPSLLLNLAESLGKLGRYQEMANTLEASIRMQPTAAAYERLGYAHFKSRQYDRASESFREAIEIDATHYPALNGLGVVLLNQYLVSQKQDTEARREALELLRRSLRINPRQSRIVELLSRYG